MLPELFSQIPSDPKIASVTADLVQQNRYSPERVPDEVKMQGTCCSGNPPPRQGLSHLVRAWRKDTVWQICGERWLQH
jgi:hypothetical protein